MTLDLEELSADDFERKLIASSKLDRLEAPNVEEAWHRFVSLTSSVGVSAGSLSGVHRVRESHAETDAPSGVAESSDTASVSAPSLAAPNFGAGTAGPVLAPVASVRWVGLKWGALGTITGALLTGGVLRIAQSESPVMVPSARVELVATPGSPTAVAQTLGAEAPTTQAPIPRAPIIQAPMTATSLTQTSLTQTVAADASKGAAGSARVAVAHAGATKVTPVAGQARFPNAIEGRSGAVGSQVPPASTLAFEVRLVDDARRALFAGNLSAAHDLIHAYRRKYPDGALTADVAFIEIKVAKARGKDELWRSLAQRFLATFPRDPHHQQVLELVNDAK